MENKTSSPIMVGKSRLVKASLITYPLSANPTKWSNTFKQFACKLRANCLSLFNHFVGLALKESTLSYITSKNGKTHFKSIAAFAAKHLKCALPFLEAMQ